VSLSAPGVIRAGNSESIGARLDRLPITPAHRAIVAIAGVGTFFDLFDIFLAGVLGTVLTDRFHLDRVSLPLVLASGFLGMFLGALGLGLMADRLGRRRAFLLNLTIYSAFTLLGAFATNASLLIATRFVAGIGIGAELPLVDAYLSELLPPQQRGRYTALAYTIGFVGVPAVGFLARLLVPRQPLGIDGWRWIFVAGSAGGTIIWWLRRRLPESPRWLESKGRFGDANAVLARLEGSRPSPVAEGACQAVVPAPGHDHALGVLFSSQYVGRTAVLWVFQVFQSVGYYGFGTLVPLVLASKGFSVVNSLTYVSAVYVGYPIGSALSIPIVERLDRRWLIVASAILMAVLGLALGLASAPVMIVAFGLSYTIVSNIFSNAFHIFQAEIFPTPVRATATSTAYGLSRLSSAAMPFVLLPVLEHSGAPAMFAAVAIAMLIVVVDIGIFAPSTTGRSLERLAAVDSSLDASSST
jgi:MFS transporter, putative metabolite:H+ symporter